MKKYIEKQRTAKNMDFIQKTFQRFQTRKKIFTPDIAKKPEEHKTIKNGK